LIMGTLQAGHDAQEFKRLLSEYNKAVMARLREVEKLRRRGI